MAADGERISGIVGCAELRIDGGFPRTATLTVETADGSRRSVRLIDPRPLAALTEVFDNCFELRIIDANAGGANQLEFGRYRVLFNDEDGPIGEATADDFEMIDSA